MNQPSPEPQDAAPQTSRGSLATLFAIVIVDLIGFGVVIPILPFYAESYGASATVLGLLLTSFAGMQFLFAPVWGRLSDRFGRRPILLSTIAGTALALLALGLAPTLTWVFVARIIGGMFGANISVASAYITDATSEEERTKYMGLLGASFAVGFILGPGIGGVLAPYGYHVPLLVAAGLAAANWVLAFFQLRESVRVDSAGIGETESSASTDRPSKRFVWPSAPRARWICVAYFVFVYSVSHLETVFAFLMMDQFGYDALHVAGILVLMGVIMAGIQGGAIRPLAKTFGERRLWIAGTLILAPCLAVVPFIHNVWILLIPLAASSVGRGLVHPSMLSMVSSAAGRDERGLVMGTFQSSASLARVAGPFAAGALYDWRLPSPFLAAGVLMFVVLGFGVWLREAAP